MQKACTSFRYRLFTSTIKSYKMNIKKNIIKAFIGGIAACLCMACGGSDSKDYWGDTSGGGDEEPTENPNAVISGLTQLPTFPILPTAKKT